MLYSCLPSNVPPSPLHRYGLCTPVKPAGYQSAPLPFGPDLGLIVHRCCGKSWRLDGSHGKSCRPDPMHQQHRRLEHQRPSRHTYSLQHRKTDPSHGVVCLGSDFRACSLLTLEIPLHVHFKPCHWWLPPSCQSALVKNPSPRLFGVPTSRARSSRRFTSSQDVSDTSRQP